MRVGVLGPLQVFDGDRELDLGGPMSRALVARLALGAGRPVSPSTLIDDLWDGEVPADATNALQSIVSRTRRRLPDGALLSAPGGYVLHAEADVDAFRTLVSAGRAREGLALWRGEALADVRDFPFAQRLGPGLEEARLAAVEEDLAARRPDAGVVAELAALTRAHPYRDGLWLLYLRALVACGRPNEALTVYESLRAQLADDLGADPSPPLQQLHAAILRGDVGPPAAVPVPSRAARSRLPASLTSFVGRDDAVEEVREALGTHRLVTVLGPGGAGKTRLAIETARASLDTVRDVWLVELATVTDPDDVTPAVLSGLGLLEVTVLETPGSPKPSRAGARQLDAVADADGLLVLDNCEHLVDAVAQVVEGLLARAPRLQVLATSREALQLIGEYTYQLGPLGLPADGAGVAQARTTPAVRLFTERALTVDRSFELDATTLPAVLEICRRLDGQPLAIELAAARLRTLAVADVAARLSDRFRLLTGGSRTLPRHRTLRAVVEWSWDLLTEAERDLAERVAVFPAGVTSASAAAVSDGATATAELLESLAEKSLLVPVRRQGRFRMLETLREYGVERLVERGIVEKVRGAQLDHAVDLAESLGQQLSDARQVEAIGVLDVERGNLTAALRYAIDRRDRSRAARIVRAMGFYWAIRNEHVELDSMVRALLDLPGEADPALEIGCLALGVAGDFMMRREGVDPTVRIARILQLWDEHHPDDAVTAVAMAALQIFGRIGDRVLPPPPDLWTASMISTLRLAMMENDGKTEGTAQLLEETIAGFRACGEAWGLAAVLNLRGTLQAYDGDFAGAIETLSEALPLLELLGAEQDAAFCRLRLLNWRLASSDGQAQLGVLRAELTTELDGAVASLRAGGQRPAFARLSLAQVEHLAGDDAASAARLREMLTDLDDTDPFGGAQFEAMARASLAIADAGCGQAGTARTEMQRATRLALEMNDMPVAAFVVVAAAVLTERLDDDLERAARLLGAADAVRGRRDLSNVDGRALRSRLEERLGLGRTDELVAEGAATDRATALAFALAPDPTS